ncbi:MAG: 23S rRNA (adenine(2503)-C(2))-methyltransferase RlmN, partial [Nitrospinae bacterium]|nr:23S rRNA (adenine(2503)-C(2))-methyltransferase RlmN [Nitrospinota bacterium]
LWEEQLAGISPAGIPGTSSNVPAARAPEVATAIVEAIGESQSQKSQSQTFAVSKTILHVVEPPGRIRRIATAVLINDGLEMVEEDGEEIESVWMPDGHRKTLCISTQSGCRLGCTFCLTGTLGLLRNLTSAEIVGQFMAVNEDLEETDRVTNVVLMGMGEPLDNYEAVVDAVRLMISPEGLRISTRKVTLSTAGMVDKIKMFKNENLPVNLAISLNATEDKTRNMIMPINKKYPIKVLLESLRDYPLKPNRRFTFEYVLLGGINDTDEDAVRLANLLKNIPSKINLIPFNSYNDAGYRPPSEERVKQFQNYLMSKSFNVFIRKNRGADILGACGQLAGRKGAASSQIKL